MSADGSPDLLSGAALAAAPQAASSDSASSMQTTRADWGLYIESNKLIEPDSIVALEYRRDWTVADYPMEKGSFTSYDKVARPFDVRLRMTKGGSESTRSAFILAVETIAESLELFDIVTPVKTYLSVTIQAIGYSQTADSGAGLVIFDIGLRQVRETASSALTVATVQDPGTTDTVSGGTVQPQAVPAPTQAEIKAAVKERQAEIDANMFSTPAF